MFVDYTPPLRFALERVIRRTASGNRRASRLAPRRISGKVFRIGNIFRHCSPVGLTFILLNDLAFLYQHNIGKIILLVVVCYIVDYVLPLIYLVFHRKLLGFFLKSFLIHLYFTTH